MRLGSGVAMAVAVALIRPLAWEPPCALGVALKKREREREREKKTVLDSLRTLAIDACHT